jgi:hypothetical protein
VALTSSSESFIGAAFFLQNRKSSYSARRGRRPPFLSSKRPARPYKSPIETRFT